ncbi:MAG: hypothetical protein SFZ23_00365 [Planctomycetota bacterium]|nr:hypothetical protein [Planctomycetota bacterium]
MILNRSFGAFVAVSILVACCGSALGQAGGYFVYVAEPNPSRGHSATTLSAVNDGGVAVGSSDTPGTFTTLGVMKTVDAISYYVSSTDCRPYGYLYFVGITNLNTIVGVDATQCGGFHRPTITTSANPAIRSIVTAALPGAGDAVALEANDNGVIVGWSNTQIGCPPPLCTMTTAHPIRWTNGVLEPLNMAGRPVGFAAGVNLVGDACGSLLPGNPLSFEVSNAVVWPYGSTNGILLPTLGGAYGHAEDISDGGAIVGWSLNANGAKRATMWIGGTSPFALDLGVLEGDVASAAIGVNGSTQSVGQSISGSGVATAVYFTGRGQVVDLNTRLINNTQRVRLTDASCLNNNGWITANGVLPNGQRRGAILVPCVENPSVQAPTTLCRGEEFAISVVPVGAATTYQWRKDGVPIDPMVNPSSITATLTGIARYASIGAYDCLVTSECGAAESDAVGLVVCLGDYNCDDVSDFFDYLNFIQDFAEERPAADINEDGSVDFFDYLELVQWSADPRCQS